MMTLPNVDTRAVVVSLLGENIWEKIVVMCPLLQSCEKEDGSHKTAKKESPKADSNNLTGVLTISAVIVIKRVSIMAIEKKQSRLQIE